jgi:hypothetical protein
MHRRVRVGDLEDIVNPVAICAARRILLPAAYAVDAASKLLDGVVVALAAINGSVALPMRFVLEVTGFAVAIDAIHVAVDAFCEDPRWHMDDAAVFRLEFLIVVAIEAAFVVRLRETLQGPEYGQ